MLSRLLPNDGCMECVLNLIPGRINALNSFNIVRMYNLFSSESHISTLLRIHFETIDIFKININHIDCLTIKGLCMCYDWLSRINKFFSILATFRSDWRYVIVATKNNCLLWFSRFSRSWRQANKIKNHSSRLKSDVLLKTSKLSFMLSKPIADSIKITSGVFWKFLYVEHISKNCSASNADSTFGRSTACGVILSKMGRSSCKRPELMEFTLTPICVFGSFWDNKLEYISTMFLRAVSFADNATPSSMS